MNFTKSLVIPLVAALSLSVAQVVFGQENGQAMMQGMHVDLLSITPEPASVSVAQDSPFRVRVFGLYSDASASYKYDADNDALDSKVDFEDALGMDLSRYTGGALIGFNFGKEHRWHCDISFNGYFDYDGKKVSPPIIIDNTVLFGTLKSDAKLYDSEFELRYDLNNPITSPVTFSLTGGVRMFVFNGSINAVEIGKSGSLDLLAPLPVLGGQVRWNINPNIYLEGAANGMWLGSYGDFFNVSAEVGYDFNKNVGAFVGYRYWALNVEYDKSTYDINMGSLYVGVEFRK